VACDRAQQHEPETGLPGAAGCDRVSRAEQEVCGDSRDAEPTFDGDDMSNVS